MKIQSSKTPINKYIFYSKIFETIKIPENRNGFGEIQKYITKLRKSVKLLEQSKSNDKINQRNSMHPSKSVILKNKKLEKEKETKDIINDYKSDKINRSNTKDDSRINSKSRFCKDKLSVLKKLLKNKNKKINNTYNNNNNTINIDLIHHHKYNEKLIRKMPKLKKDQIFMTSFDYPKNDKLQENNNNKDILKTELNENKNITNINHRFSLPKIEPKSSRVIMIQQKNTRNGRLKSHLLRPNISSATKRIRNMLNKNDKEKEKDYIIGLNKKLISFFGYAHKHPAPSNQDIENFIKELKNIKKILNKKCYEYELDKWNIRAKMKYVDWKFRINELEKYFINVDEFGIKEKNELKLRKSFYKKLNILIDELKEEKEKKKIKEREKSYGIDLKKEDEKIMKNNEYWNIDKTINFLSEQYQFLKKVKDRKIKEQKNRELIQSILIKSRQSVFNINNS